MIKLQLIKFSIELYNSYNSSLMPINMKFNFALWTQEVKHI